MTSSNNGKPSPSLLPMPEALEILSQSIGAGLAVIALDYTALWTNNVIDQIYGDTVGQKCYQAYQGQADICPGCAVRDVFEKGLDRVVREVVSRDKKGNIIQLEIIATPIRNAQGEITSALELVLPITDKKRNERALTELLAFSQSLVSAADLQSLYRKITALSKELLEFDVSTLMLMDHDRSALVVKDTIGFPEETIGHYALLKGQGLSTHVVLEKKSAQVDDFRTETRFEIPDLVFTHNLRSALCVPMMLGEEVFGVLIGHTLEPRIFPDDTINVYQSFANQAAVAIKNAMHSHSLRASEKKFRALFDSTNDAIIIHGLDGSLLEANQAACTRLGYTREELLALPLDRVVAAPYAAMAKERIGEIIAKGKAIFESAHIRKDSSIVPIEQSCSLFDIDNQQVILCVSRDISERKRFEDERLRSQKLESLGVLAGGIAHDFNNLLTGILGNLSLINTELPGPGSLAERLIETEKAAIRAKDLTQQLLTFAKGGAPVKIEASLAEIVREASLFATRGTNAVCVYDIPPDLWMAEVDKGQLSQVIQNLAINAAHAMPGGGTIELTAANTVIGQDGNIPLAPGKYVQITVTDRGSGIAPDDLTKIFDPYFTTKTSGSGLGLAVVYSIIANHSGRIGVESEINKGTTFSIYLPSSGKSAQTTPLASTGATEGKSHGTILVMDDEEIIRKVSSAMLTWLGYEVHTAANGEEAIALYRQAKEAGHPFDLVIMDLTVPGGMGGKETVARLRQIDPEVKAVVSSGYANDPIMANFKDAGFCGVAPKPFTVEELSRLLRDVLGA